MLSLSPAAAGIRVQATARGPCCAQACTPLAHDPKRRSILSAYADSVSSSGTYGAKPGPSRARDTQADTAATCAANPRDDRVLTALHTATATTTTHTRARARALQPAVHLKYRRHTRTPSQRRRVTRMDATHTEIVKQGDMVLAHIHTPYTQRAPH